VWESVVHLISGGMVAFLVKGGIIMIPIVASSVIALTVIAERFSYWRHLRSQNVDSTILALVGEGNFDDAYRVASRSTHPLAHILKAELENKNVSPGTAMAAAAQVEIGQFRRFLPILDTIITLAPLLRLR
jgi:biopolymer transport protein ExbB